MLCPKCRESMEEVQTESVTVDRCLRCRGLWFDRGEAEALTDNWIAAYLDDGDPQQGARQDEHDRIGCPRCGVVMRHHFNLEAALQYEECDKHGRYFDPG